MPTGLHCDVDLGADALFVSGQSAAIQAVNEVVEGLAATDIPVLIVGESGTGKEVYARLIHRRSRYVGTPLTKLSCRALDSGEFLAQLRSSMKVEAGLSSHGGRTIFLDGIEELDLACQKALLSVLPDGEHEQNRSIPVRLIASASRNLEKDIERGQFRRELFFRINGVCLRLPTLRERKEDIPLLLEHFLARNTGADREIAALSQEELAFVGTHEWPGNIRELENFARKVALFGRAREAITELQSAPTLSSGLPADHNISLKAVARTASRQAEREIIRQALERTHWNRKRAAKELNVSYKSLLYKIKQTGLEAE